MPHLFRRLRPARLSAVAVVALAMISATGSTNPDADPLSRSAFGDRTAQVVETLRAHGNHEGGLLRPPSAEAATTLITRSDPHRRVKLDSPRGGRVFTASQLASHDVPQAAVAAYRNAAASLAGSDPGCRLPWTLLAAIGRVESDHGRYGGSVLSTDAVSRPKIIGVALDGRGPVAAIHDTDGGRLDGDSRWDRAVGPMQFIPSTWAGAGRDGDGDGQRNPHDLDDAALAAGDYLCAGGDLSDGDLMAAAILRYNPSDYYVRLVLAFEEGYRTGIFVIPSPAAPDASDKADRQPRSRDDVDRRPQRADRPAARPAEPPSHKPHAEVKPKPRPKQKPKSRPSPSPSRPSPSQPAPTPTPTPSQPASPAVPSPAPSPTTEAVTGSLTSCPAGWCLAGTPLDLGPASAWGQQALADYDRDSALETLQAELEGIAAGAPVTIRGERVGPVLVVRDIGGLAFPR